MGYEVWKLKCSNRKHGEMEYRGDGDYVCLVCGEIYHDDEFDDEESGLWSAVALHGLFRPAILHLFLTIA